MRGGNDDAITNQRIRDLVSEYTEVLGEVPQSTGVAYEFYVFAESSYAIGEEVWDTFAGMAGWEGRPWIVGAGDEDEGTFVSEFRVV